MCTKNKSIAMKASNVGEVTTSALLDLHTAELPCWFSSLLSMVWQPVAARRVQVKITISSPVLSSVYPPRRALTTVRLCSVWWEAGDHHDMTSFRIGGFNAFVEVASARSPDWAVRR